MLRERGRRSLQQAGSGGIHKGSMNKGRCRDKQHPGKYREFSKSNPAVGAGESRRSSGGKEGPGFIRDISGLECTP